MVRRIQQSSYKRLTTAEAFLLISTIRHLFERKP